LEALKNSQPEASSPGFIWHPGRSGTFGPASIERRPPTNIAHWGFYPFSQPCNFSPYSILLSSENGTLSALSELSPFAAGAGEYKNALLLDS
jgi:hypothetical protein